MRLFGLGIRRAAKRSIKTTSGEDWFSVHFENVSGSFGGTTAFLEGIYQTVANEFSKIDFFPAISTESDDGTVDYRVDSKSPTYEVLSLRANEYLSAADFRYILAYQTFRYQNFIAHIVKNSLGQVIALEPIDVTQYEFGNGYQTTDGRVYLKIRERKNHNKVSLIPYSDCIHIRLNPNNFFNGDKTTGVAGVENIIEVFDENLSTILKQLSEGGTVKGVISVGDATGASFNQTQLSSADKLKKQKEVAERIQKLGKEGILVLDAAETWHDLTVDYKTMSADEIQTLMEYVYLIKGISQKVAAGTATAEEMEVFFSRTIAPLIEKFVEECTYKFYTQTARTQGKFIDFKRDVFEYVNAAESINSAYKALGFTTQNELRRSVLKFPPAQGGDVMLLNKNFVPATSVSEGGDSDGD